MGFSVLAGVTCHSFSLQSSPQFSDVFSNSRGGEFSSAVGPSPITDPEVVRPTWLCVSLLGPCGPKWRCLRLSLQLREKAWLQM